MEQLNIESDNLGKQDTVRQIDNLKILEEDYWYQIKNRIRRLDNKHVPMMAVILRNQVKTNGLLYKVNHELRRDMQEVRRARRALKFDSSPSNQPAEAEPLVTIEETNMEAVEPLEKRKPLSELNV